MTTPDRPADVTALREAQAIAWAEHSLERNEAVSALFRLLPDFLFPESFDALMERVVAIETIATRAADAEVAGLRAALNRIASGSPHTFAGASAIPIARAALVAQPAATETCGDAPIRCTLPPGHDGGHHDSEGGWAAQPAAPPTTGHPERCYQCDAIKAALAAQPAAPDEVAGYVNTGSGHDRAMAWSEGHTAGYEEALGHQREQMVAVPVDMGRYTASRYDTDTLHRLHIWNGERSWDIDVPRATLAAQPAAPEPDRTMDGQDVIDAINKAWWAGHDAAKATALAAQPAAPEAVDPFDNPEVRRQRRAFQDFAVDAPEAEPERCAYPGCFEPTKPYHSVHRPYEGKWSDSAICHPFTPAPR